MSHLPCGCKDINANIPGAHATPALPLGWSPPLCWAPKYHQGLDYNPTSCCCSSYLTINKWGGGGQEQKQNGRQTSVYPQALLYLNSQQTTQPKQRSCAGPACSNHLPRVPTLHLPRVLQRLTPWLRSCPVPASRQSHILFKDPPSHSPQSTFRQTITSAESKNYILHAWQSVAQSRCSVNNR